MLSFLRRLFGRQAADLPGPGRQGPIRPQGAAQSPPRTERRPIPAERLDLDAVKIVKRLTRYEHTAYLVGGCVRDLLLDRRPKDFDVATSATPRQVRRLFRNCRIIGRRFRLAHIYFGRGKIIEVATFRALDDPAEKQKEEDVLIREDNVFGSPEEDALRRDFTINSLYYDVNDETVVDHSGGLDDLARRLVRTIGDPSVRFREDPIRILRAIKFAARLDFTIEEETLAALRATRLEIPRAAPPRILEELNRFCRGGAARRSFELMRETGVLEVVLPEIAEPLIDEPDGLKLLSALLERMDRQRFQEKEEIRTGEILAVLALAAFHDPLGLKADGSVDAEAGTRVRELLEPRLKPLSVRLRVPRREMELCREIVGTTLRAMGTSNLRPKTRSALQARDSLPYALWILSAMGELWGGAYQEAERYWSERARNRPKSKRATAEQAGDGRTARRRRGRRGGRSRRPEESRTPTADSVEPQRADKPAGKPKEWDFFSALPSVPDGDPEIASAPPAAEGDESPPETGSRPRRRRRRPRRRRPRGEGGEDDAVAEKADSESADPPGN